MTFALPQDLEAEEHVLGAMLLTSKACDVVSEILAPTDFYRDTHGRIYRTMLDLHGRGEPADVITVSAALPDEFRVRLHELAHIVPASANVAHYARIVKAAAVRRGVIRLGTEWTRKAYEGEIDVDEFEQAVYDLERHRTGDEETVPDVLQGIIRTISYLREHPREVVGVPTGYPDLDRITQGFQPGNLIILAARPGMGKSAFAICVAAKLTSERRGLPVGFWTLEMSKPEILQRMLSMGSGIDVPRIRAPWHLSDEEEAKLIQAAGRIAVLPLDIREPATLRPLELRAQVRRWKQQNPEAALVVVDYLQLMEGGKHSENRTQEVSHISRMLKVLAREMEVPVLALSQLSRAVESRGDKRPMLSDLRESGSIEQDADVVVFLYRDDYYNPQSETPGVVEVIVAKNRNGETGTARLGFLRGQTRFTTLAKPHLAGDVGVAA